jgi:hypothetical protein
MCSDGPLNNDTLGAVACAACMRDCGTATTVVPLHLARRGLHRRPSTGEPTGLDTRLDQLSVISEDHDAKNVHF